LTSNLKCCCGGDAQILKVYPEAAYAVRELRTAGAKVLWVCLNCGNLEHLFVTIQEIVENERLFGMTA